MLVSGTMWAIGSTLSLVGLGIIGCCCGGTQQQQQTIRVDDDEPKRICPECGMENPREAEHCGDCGFAFKTGEEDE
jgi:predicted amidophosphoribosyltransferase